MARPPITEDSFVTSEDSASESENQRDTYITITGDDNTTINIYI